MYKCGICNRGFKTQIEAKACFFRDDNDGTLPPLDFVKPVGHEGKCF